MAQLSKEDIILANKISERIKELRILSTGLKQIDFANKHNIDRQILNRWESKVKIDEKTGRPKGRGITVYTVERFCKMLDITLKDFFDAPAFKK